jgi:hypothetical protein
MMTVEGLDRRLEEHRRVWDSKPNLRAVYADYHRRHEEARPSGRLLAIGAARRISKLIVSSTFCGIDVVAEARECPFAPAILPESSSMCRITYGRKEN